MRIAFHLLAIALIGAGMTSACLAEEAARDGGGSTLPANPDGSRPPAPCRGWRKDADAIDTRITVQPRWLGKRDELREGDTKPRPFARHIFRPRRSVKFRSRYARRHRHACRSPRRHRARKGGAARYPSARKQSWRRTDGLWRKRKRRPCQDRRDTWPPAIKCISDRETYRAQSRNDQRYHHRSAWLRSVQRRRTGEAGRWNQRDDNPAQALIRC